MTNITKAPLIFHNKPENSLEHFFLFPDELFAAINTLFCGNEAKIMLTLLGCKGDGSFMPSAEYMLKMTGINDRSNYFTTRKNLKEKGYLQETSGSLTIDVERILNDYRCSI